VCENRDCVKWNTSSAGRLAVQGRDRHDGAGDKYGGGGETVLSCKCHSIYQCCTPLVVPSAVDEHQPPQVTELGDSEVGGIDSLHALLATNAHTNVRGLGGESEWAGE
jgi:hypothetical protein